MIPGTGVIYTLSTGIKKGKMMSIYASIGCTLGVLPHLIIGLLGLTLFQSLDNFFFNTIKIVGSVYLFYMGIQLFRTKHNDISVGRNIHHSVKKNILNGILINLLNPKLTIFFLAFLPQFIDANNYSIIFHGIILGLIFMLITFLVFTMYGLGAATFSHYILNDSNAILSIQRVFGLIFIFFAIQLAFSHISVPS
jgi:threonine/homoserine/homoserine lactone efflux protein